MPRTHNLCRAGKLVHSLLRNPFDLLRMEELFESWPRGSEYNASASGRSATRRRWSLCRRERPPPRSAISWRAKADGAGRPSQKAKEIIHGQTSLLEDMYQRGTLDWTMGRYHQLEHLVGQVLLESNMAAPLPNHHPAIALESPKNLDVRQARDFAYTVISICSESG